MRMIVSFTWVLDLKQLASKLVVALKLLTVLAEPKSVGL